MPVVSNNPDGYKGIEPQDPYIMGTTPANRHIVERDGLYYRDDIDADFLALTQSLLENGAESELSTYQYWAESGWKTEHGTFSSVERFATKVREEYGEFVEAVNDGSTDEIVSEAGDALWCFTALASNGAGDISQGLKTQINEYADNMLHADERGVVLEPIWRPKAVTLTQKAGSLTVGEITDLIKAKFEPTISPIMIVDADEYDEDVRGHLQSLFYGAYGIEGPHHRQYGYNDTETTIEDFYRQSVTVLRLVSMAVLQIAFIVPLATEGAADFGDVVAHNVEKVSARIQQGRVDKTDGERTEDLL